jgi:hypothetical protein
MYTAWIERRGLSGEDGRLLVEPAGNTRTADELNSDELNSSLSILVGGTSPAAPHGPGGGRCRPSSPTT